GCASCSGDVYGLQVAWGDGTTSTGTVATTAGGLTGRAQHTYGTSGRYAITATVSDAGGATAASGLSVLIDTTPPVTTATVTGSPGTNGWWKCCLPTQLNLSATDDL